MRKTTIFKRAAALGLVTLMSLTLLASCTPKSEKTAISSAAQLNDASYTVGVPQGASAQAAVEQTLPKAKVEHYTSDATAYLAVQQGKIDAFAYDKVMLEFALAKGLTGVKILPDTLGDSIDIAIGISPKSDIPDLQARVNAFLSELKADGTLDDMHRRWITEADDTMPDIPVPTSPALTLAVGTTGMVQPFSYYKGEDLNGYDIEMIHRLAAYLNAKVEIRTYDYEGIAPAAQSGAIDLICANLNVTEERKQAMLFSDAIYQSQNAMLVKDSTAPDESGPVPLERANFGVMTGSTAEKFLTATYPQAKISTFSGIADAFVALSAGKLDYVLTAYTTALNAVRTDPSLTIYQKDVINESVAIAVTKENTALLTELNEVLAEFKTDGTLDKVIAHWTTQGQDYTVEDLPRSDGANGVLRVAIAADREPMCFVLDGQYRGIDCELIERMAYELGMTVEYQNMSFSSLIAALKSGKADVIISNMTPTAERSESVSFTDTYFDNPQVLVAQKGAEATRYGVTGIVAQSYVEKTYPGASISMYPSADAALLALQSDKVDVIMTSRATARYMMKGDAALSIAQDNVVDEACYIALPKGSALVKNVDAAIDQLRADGTLDEINARWTEAEPDGFEAVEVPEAEGKNGTLRVALSPDAVPICFLLDGKYAGIDVELVERIALLLDMKVEFATMDFDALLPALKSGKADMALSDLNATPERREAADFSQAYFDNPQVFLTRSEGDPAAGVAQVSFWEGLKQSFVKNFITDNRWKLIVKGLEVTVLISIASGIVGSVLGFAICIARRSKYRLLSGLTAAFIRIIQGTPIVVFLMILYYVIFQPFRNMPAEVAAIIGFSVNFGVYVSEMMRTGLDAVDRGQIEAANALGYNRYQTFTKIAFPQAARHFLPVFKGEFIGMVKMTSVVGYIAIQDLTKVSDIIRSSTLDAFFPLIATAILYFLVSNLLILLLSRVELSLDPKRRKRTVKGVELK